MALDVGSIEAKLGARVDERGFREFDAAMARVDKAVAEAKATIKVDQPAFIRARREIDSTEKSTKNLGDRISELAHGMNFLDSMMAHIKWEAMFAGAGLATQGIAALSAGVIGLVSALAPLTGALMAYPALLGAFGQAMGVVALSGVNDLGAAVGGLNEELDTTSDEFKALTPQGKKFATFLDTLKPKMLTLKESVQGPLFRGLEDGIDAALKNMPAFRRVLHGTSDALGDFATNFGELVGSKQFGQDFERIGENNNQVLRRMGRFAIDVTSGFRHLLIAAEPLVDWMGRSAVKWGRHFEQERKAGRQSGETAKFFEETRKVMERLWKIGSSLGEVFSDIGEAAQPLGNWILGNLNEELRKLAGWTDSTTGKVGLALFFESAKQPLEAIWHLVEEVSAAFLRLSLGDELPAFINLIADELVPVLEDLAEHALEVFSDPQMMANFTEFIELFGNLFGFTGPMVAFIDVLGGIAKTFNDIFDWSPAIKTTTTTLIGFYSVLAMIGTLKGLHSLLGGAWATSFIKKMPGVRKALDVLKDGYETFALKAMVWKDTAIEAAAGWIGSFRAKIGDGMRKVRDIAASAMKRVSTWTTAAGEAIASFAGAMAAKVPDRFKEMGKRAGRFFMLGLLLALPLLLPELYKFGQEIGKTIRAPVEQAMEDMVNFIIARLNNVIDAMNAANPFGDPIGRIGEADFAGPAPTEMVEPEPGSRQRLKDMWNQGTPGAPAFPGAQKNKGFGAPGWLGGPLDDKSVEDQDKKGKKIADDADKNFGSAAKSGDKHGKSLSDFIDKWSKKAQGDFSDATTRIDRDSDRHLGSAAKTADKRSREFAGAVGGGAKSASDAVHEGTSYIAKQVSKALKSLGAEAPQFQLEGPPSLSGTEKQKFYAGGGMIGGYGNRDTVPLTLGMAAPGEAILTKYQQQIVNAALGTTFGMGLPDLFARERRPHYFASGGFVDPAGPGHGVVAPSIAGTVGKWSLAYNAAINYGYDPGGGHVSPGHNVTGTATDTVPAAGWTAPGATALFEQGLRKLVAQGLTVGYGTAGIGEAWSNHGRGNHAHIEWGGAGGINVAMVEMLKRIAVNGPDGTLKTMAQSALDKVRKAGNSKLRKAQAAMSAIDGMAGGGGPGSMGTAQFLSTALKALRITEHFPAVSANAQKLLILARQESGLNPNSINNWDSNAAAGNPSGGLLHTTESTFRAYHEPGTANTYFDPLASIAASINYQHDRYGGLVTHSPYARGGFLGGVSSLLSPNLGLNRRLARRRGRAVLNGIGFDGRLGQALTFGAKVDDLRERGRKNALEDLLDTRRGRKYRSRVVGRMPGVFDRLDAAAQLAPRDANRKLGSMMKRLNRAGLGSFARGSASQIRNTLAVSRAQNSVFGNFARGGYVGGGASAGAVGMVPIVNVTPVFEGDARLLDLRVKRVVVTHERDRDRQIGLDRQTAGLRRG